MALFITFEGGEGSGKSFQAGILYRKLLRMAVPVLLTLEPGGTALGTRLARLLKRAQGTGISPLSELLLFNASRAQLVEEVIMPALSEEKVVICDRYADSTTAYQSYGRGLDLDMVKMINSIGTRGLKPDLTILLDMPAEAGLARKKDTRHDRFEQEDLAFHNRIRAGYLKLAADDPERWLMIDANQPKTMITKIIWEKVSRLVAPL